MPRQQTKIQRRRAKRKRGGDPGKGNSNYARKVAYCRQHNVRASDVPEPKPWK
jgi:hypothetical protein